MALGADHWFFLGHKKRWPAMALRECRPCGRKLVAPRRSHKLLVEGATFWRPATVGQNQLISKSKKNVDDDNKKNVELNSSMINYHSCWTEWISKESHAKMPCRRHRRTPLCHQDLQSLLVRSPAAENFQM